MRYPNAAQAGRGAGFSSAVMSGLWCAKVVAAMSRSAGACRWRRDKAQRFGRRACLPDRGRKQQLFGAYGLRINGSDNLVAFKTADWCVVLMPSRLRMRLTIRYAPPMPPQSRLLKSPAGACWSN